MNVDVKGKTKDTIYLDIEKKRYYIGKSDKYIEFDDADINIPVRLTEAIEDINKYIQDFKTKYGIEETDDINKVSTGDIQKDIALMKEADNFVRNKVDFIFDGNVSKNAFGRASTMSVTKKGEYYFENLLNAVIPHIEETFNVRINKISARAEAYLKK